MHSCVFENGVGYDGYDGSTCNTPPQEGVEHGRAAAPLVRLLIMHLRQHPRPLCHALGTVFFTPPSALKYPRIICTTLYCPVLCRAFLRCDSLVHNISTFQHFHSLCSTILYVIVYIVEVRGLMILWYGRSGGNLVMYFYVLLSFNF